MNCVRMDGQKKFIFCTLLRLAKVDTKANKVQIKQAIEKIFNVKVESVNTMNSHPKKKRVGRYTGMTNKYKKAIVKLAKGSTISFD